MQFNQSKYSTIHNWYDLSSISGFLTMGNFDGVHLAHKNLIKEAKRYGKVTVLTYSPHPAIALGRVKGPFLLTTDYEKLEIFKELEVDDVIFLKFDNEIASMTPGDFLKKVVRERLNPDGVIIGYDHHFGKGRKGNAEFLSEMGERLKFKVVIYPETRVNNEVVKSTVIRELIHEGEISLVNKLLSHPYKIRGSVIEGNGLGSDLGYPTANIKINSKYKLIPPEGVYSAVAKIEKYEYPAMLYIGSSPTYGIKERKIEIHLLDFSGDLYSKDIECNIYSFIRDEKYFSSERSLKECIDKNKGEVIENLKEVYRWDLHPKKNKN